MIDYFSFSRDFSEMVDWFIDNPPNVNLPGPISAAFDNGYHERGSLHFESTLELAAWVAGAKTATNAKHNRYHREIADQSVFEHGQYVESNPF